MAKEIIIPYKPRPYQKVLHDLIDKHGFVVAGCHRRFGKSLALTMHMIREALKTKKPNWRGYIVTPTISMGKAIHFDYWQTMTKNIPDVVFNKTELSCEFSNGSRMQLVGANDGGERLRGRAIDFCCIDETQMVNEELFNQIIRPALVDRNELNGEKTRCVFIGTPKLQNYFYKVYQHAISEESGKEWQGLLLPVSETKVVPNDELEQAKKIMGLDSYEQEFEVSFSANISGSYYGAYVQKAYDEGRIAQIDEDVDLETEVYADIGINDMTSLWYVQRNRHEYRFLEYEEYSGEGLQYLADLLHKKQYNITRVVMPHDIKVRDLSLGVSRFQILSELGINNIDIAPKIPIQDGIAQVRHQFDNFWFDERMCALGINHLKGYTKVYDSRHNIFRDRPLHNEHSHCADALRTGLAVGNMRTSDWSQPLEYNSAGIV